MFLYRVDMASMWSIWECKCIAFDFLFGTRVLAMPRRGRGVQNNRIYCLGPGFLQCLDGQAGPK